MARGKGLIQMTGTRFGDFEVIGRHPCDGAARWICKCHACGRTKVYFGYDIRNLDLSRRHLRSIARCCGVAFSEVPESVPGAKWLPLSGGMFALVDNADFEEVSKFVWSAIGKEGYYYAARKPKDRPLVFLHRWLLDAGESTTVDHINHNTLDDRRNNLRTASRNEQMQNRSKNRNNKSGFKGVYQSREGRWKAQIGTAGKRVYLGTFQTAQDAAAAYDAAARRFFGEFSFTNDDMRGL